MHRVITIYLSAFLVDGLLVIAGSSHALANVQVALTAALFAFSLALYAALALNRRLPKRTLLPPILYLIWARICGGFPLAFLGVENFAAALGVVQALLALALLVPHIRQSPGAIAQTPAFGWKNFVLLLIAALILTPLALTASAINAVGAAIENRTGGYVKLRSSGILLGEREFEKDGKRVRLVGMMHIGDSEFYQGLASAIPGDTPLVVLMEGVNDREGLLHGGFSYVSLAKNLGLSAQETEFTPPPKASRIVYRNSDVDVNTFHPASIEFIKLIGKFLAKPTLQNAIDTFSTNNSVLTRPDIEQILRHDLETSRNQHLTSEITSALKDYDFVLVPWGAIHLPVIEAALENEGFRRVHEVDRPVIRFLHPAKPILQAGT